MQWCKCFFTTKLGIWEIRQERPRMEGIYHWGYLKFRTQTEIDRELEIDYLTDTDIRYKCVNIYSTYHLLYVCVCELLLNICIWFGSWFFFLQCTSTRYRKTESSSSCCCCWRLIVFDCFDWLIDWSRTSQLAAIAQFRNISYDSVALIYQQGVIVWYCLVGLNIEMKAIATESPNWIAYLGRFFNNARCV